MVRKFIFIMVILISGLEIMSRVGVKPIEFYNVPMRNGFVGLALYPVIMYKHSEDIVKYNLNGASTQIHERHHHKQAERMGFLAYKLTYAYNQLTVGYCNNPLEIEAYEAEKGHK